MSGLTCSAPPTCGGEAFKGIGEAAIDRAKRINEPPSVRHIVERKGVRHPRATLSLMEMASLPAAMEPDRATAEQVVSMRCRPGRGRTGSRSGGAKIVL